MGETGWATAGDSPASGPNANTYYSNILKSMNSSSSMLYGVKIFFFELFDENEKKGSSFEPNFGVYDQDGNMKSDFKHNDLKLLFEGPDPNTPKPPAPQPPKPPPGPGPKPHRSPGSPTEKSSSSSDFNYLWVLIPILLLLVIAVIVFFVYKNYKNNYQAIDTESDAPSSYDIYGVELSFITCTRPKGRYQTIDRVHDVLMEKIMKIQGFEDQIYEKSVMINSEKKGTVTFILKASVDT